MLAIFKIIIKFLEIFELRESFFIKKSQILTRFKLYLMSLQIENINQLQYMYKYKVFILKKLHQLRINHFIINPIKNELILHHYEKASNTKSSLRSCKYVFNAITFYISKIFFA